MNCSRLGGEQVLPIIQVCYKTYMWTVIAVVVLSVIRTWAVRNEATEFSR